MPLRVGGVAHTTMLDPRLLEDEHLVGKLKLAEMLERTSPYREMATPTEHRIAAAFGAIPEHLQQAALAIFANILYIPKQMMNDSWAYVWQNYLSSLPSVPAFEEFLFLELDRDQIRDEFYRANNLFGRLQDNLPWRSMHDIIDGLMALEQRRLDEDLARQFVQLLSRKHWVLLVDLSLSGTSAASELARIAAVHSLWEDERVSRPVALLQLATEEASTVLASGEHDFRRGIVVPNCFALSKPDYSLVRDIALVQQMREVCRWFARTHVQSSGYRLADMSRTDEDVAVYGFGKSGWNVVTHKNTPNNSLPILWFKPPNGAYEPPYERLDSRISLGWQGRKQWVEQLESDETKRKNLRKLIGI